MSFRDIQQSKSSVYATLDAWRGLACLAVVLCHATVTLGGERVALRSLAFYRVAAYGRLGVHVFFVISGYCVVTAAISTLRRSGGVKSYAWSRIRRIYPPYWFSLLLLVGASGVLAILSHNGGVNSSSMASGLRSHSFMSLVVNILLVQMAFHKSSLLLVAWTLSYEVGFYAIIGIFLLAARGASGERMMLNGLHTFTLICLAIVLVLPRYAVYPINLWPEFGFGILVYDIVKHPAYFVPWMFGLATAALMFGILWTLSDRTGSPSEEAVSREACVVALGFAIIIGLIYRHDQVLSRLRFIRGLSFVGTFSYSLYLVHLLAIGVVLWAFKRIGVEYRHHYLYVTVATLFSLPVAYLFYRFFEKPFMSSRMRSRVEAVAEPILGNGELAPMGLVS